MKLGLRVYITKEKGLVTFLICHNMDCINCRPELSQSHFFQDVLSVE